MFAPSQEEGWVYHLCAVLVKIDKRCGFKHAFYYYFIIMDKVNFPSDFQIITRNNPCSPKVPLWDRGYENCECTKGDCCLESCINKLQCKEW